MSWRTGTYTPLRDLAGSRHLDSESNNHPAYGLSRLFKVGNAASSKSFCF